jgi:hypothetical protein
MLSISSPLFAGHIRGHIYLGPIIRIYPYDPFLPPFFPPIGPFYPGPHMPPPTAPNWGYIDTDVEPEEAKIYLDDKYIGIADDYDGYPAYLRVPLGSHKIEFRLEGYEPLSQTLNINPGQFITINFKMMKATEEKKPLPKPEESLKEKGVVTLGLDPVLAEILVDGAVIGTGEDLQKKEGKLELPIGKRRLEFRKSGYKTQSIEVEIKAGSAFSLGIKLEKE